MIENNIGLSQQLNSRSYNDYLSRPMQNTKINPNAAMPAQSQMGQAQGGSILDSMGFASELRSQNTVSALMKLNSPATGFAPTLSEQGATVDGNGNISIPKSGNPTLAQERGNANTHAPSSANSANSTNSASPAQPAQSTQNTKMQIAEETLGIPMNGRNKSNQMTANIRGGLPLNGVRVFALDNRSLGILNKIAKKKEITLNDTNLQNAVGKDIQSNKSATAQASTKRMKIRALDGDSVDIGKLSARYESATKGSNIIGYDRNGGTSYGTYQISSKAGTFNEFLSFLDDEAPDWAQQLRDAGKANTGSRYGKVPDAWEKLCVEDPEKMKKLEHDFIVKSHYEPVASHVEEKWKGTISRALHEVIFSTAVQHGVRGAKRVFNQAFADTNRNEKTLATGNLSAEAKQSQEELIKNIYSHRSTKFGSSSSQVQEAAKNRFISEQKAALSILT